MESGFHNLERSKFVDMYRGTYHNEKHRKNETTKTEPPIRKDSKYESTNIIFLVNGKCGNNVSQVNYHNTEGGNYSKRGDHST